MNNVDGTRFQICKRCVMDASVVGTVFDENGVCNHCTSYFENEVRLISHRPLEQVFEEIKQRTKGKKYHSILGISGGIDSSYVAYLAWNAGLNLLLVNIDDGWGTTAANSNVEKIVEHTQFDFIQKSFPEKEYKDIVIAYLKASVVGLETPYDMGVRTAVYNIADEHGIKIFLDGLNHVTEGILPSAWGFDKNDVKNLKAIHKKYGTMKLKEFPMESLFGIALRYFVKGLKGYHPLNQIEFNREKAKHTLSAEWGWNDYGLKHHENRFTKFVEAYIFPEKFGFDKRLAHLSTLVCSSQMTRDEALDQLKLPVYTQDEFNNELEFFLSQLNLTKDLFDELMARPIRQHLEFSSQQLTNRFLLFMKKLFGK